MKELVNRPFAHFEAVDLNDDTDTKEFEVIDEEMEEEADEEIEENQAAPSTDEVETTEVEELESGDDTDNASNDNGETMLTNQSITKASATKRLSKSLQTKPPVPRNKKKSLRLLSTRNLRLNPTLHRPPL